MTSPAELHATGKVDSDVNVIDIEYDIENMIDTVIEKPKDDATEFKVEIDEVRPETFNLINGNGTVSETKRKPANMAEVVQKARASFNRGITRPIEWRRRQLKNLLRMYEENIDALVDALHKDLRRSRMEAIILELDLLIADVKHAINNLDDWCKPEKPKKDMINLMDGVLIYNEPYGVTLIIGAWNYPLLLLFLPTSGAIAAGNAIILKPSELAVACTNFLAQNIAKYLDPEAIVFVEGGPQETTELLKQKFDYIFYTGGTSVGRIIYEAAIKHLTPVTLELGGKSPVYIDNTVDITVTAKRILWGKFINAGQTCIAPDYILCTKEVQDRLVEAARKVLKEWYGDDAQKSSDLCRIINSRHFSRIQALIDDSKDKIAIGGRYDSNDKYIEPTLISNVTANDKVMEEEIFGPILPIMPIKNAHEAIKFINEREHPLVVNVFSNHKHIQELFNEQTRSGTISINDTVMFFSEVLDMVMDKGVGAELIDSVMEKPLVLYLFSNVNAVQKSFIENTSSGEICINETVTNIGVDTLPFGGIGNSGMGAYHGKITFDTFTHKKGCLKKDFFSVAEKLASTRYPPYTDKKLNFLRLMLRKRQLPSMNVLLYLLAFVLGAGLSYGICSWQKTTSEDS